MYQLFFMTFDKRLAKIAGCGHSLPCCRQSNAEACVMVKELGLQALRFVDPAEIISHTFYGISHHYSMDFLPKRPNVL